MNVPEWVKKACFYQIFPDRFAKSDRLTKPSNLETWDSLPTVRGFKGGDLYGLAEKLDYLECLGINAIYLCPIFASTANHRYHTYDYMQVDPILGGNDAFKFLLDAAHKKNIKVIIDGVFNHASRGFYQFNHTLENGKYSPFVDWFHFNKEWLESGKNLNPYKGRSAKQDGQLEYGYSCWWNIADLPKLNTNTKAVRDYIFNVAKHWIDFGCDGWRLDVPNEINDDSFWQEFRHVVKSANSEAYIVGEIWGDARRWLQGDQFDAVMNYKLARNIMTYFLEDCWSKSAAKRSSLDGWTERPNDYEFRDSVLETVSMYQSEIVCAQMNLLTSHDTPRLLSLASEKKQHMKLALAFMYFCPGAPCIYYGDEIGMKGFHDPHCRGAFNWNENTWDQDLQKFIKEIIAIRKEHSVLHDGSMQCIYADDGVTIWKRQNKNEKFYFAFNKGKIRKEISIVDDKINLEWKLNSKSFEWKSSKV